MPLDVAPIYCKIIETDQDRRLYGLIPLMASSSHGQIGALNAESFCERVLRGASHVLSCSPRATRSSRTRGWRCS